MARDILIACVMTTVAWVAADGDILVLKSGGRLEGEVVAENETSYTLRVGKSELSVPRDNVQKVIHRDTPAQLYRQMLKGLKPDDPEGHYQIALYCAREGMNDEARDLLRRALELRPDYPEALAELRRIIEPEARRLLDRAEKADTPGEALKLYTILGEQFPESELAPAAAHAAAELLASQGDHTAAMIRYKELLERNPRDTRAYLGAAGICERIGRFDRALEILDGVLGYERDATVRRQCLWRKSVIGKIIAARKEIEQDPNAPQHYAEVGRRLKELGLNELAVKWMVQAVEKGSHDIAIVEAVARYYDESYRVEKALKYWSKVDELGPHPNKTDEVQERIGQLKLLVMIPEYLRCTDAARRQSILAELKAGGVAIDTAEKVVRQWLDFPQVSKRGVTTRTARLPDGTEFSYVLFVPENYSPDERWPLVIALHGAAGTGDSYVFTWAKHAQRHGCLVLAPTSTENTGWSGTVGRDIVLQAYRDVRENFNIDTNRVYVDGTSMGAGGAWMFALHMPDMFAGLVSRSGGVRLLLQVMLPNAVNLPVYIVHGLRDRVIPVDSVKKARDQILRYGGDVTFRLDAKAGHSSFSNETPRILEWMAGRIRNPYPRRVVFNLLDLSVPRCYWLQAEVLDDNLFDPRKPVMVPTIHGESLDPEMKQNYILSAARAGTAQLKGVIEGNTITVETKHVIGYSILLSDAMVNLDEPIEVVTNGKQSYFGPAEPSLEFLLEWARRYRDPQMLYTAWLRIVP